MGVGSQARLAAGAVLNAADSIADKLKEIFNAKTWKDIADEAKASASSMRADAAAAAGILGQGRTCGFKTVCVVGKCGFVGS